MNSYDKLTEEELLMSSAISYFKRNKIKLYKENTYNNIEIKFHKDLIKTNNEENTIYLENKLNYFLTIMNMECKNFNPNIFIKNIKKTLFDLKRLDKISNSNNLGSVLLGPKINIFKLSDYSAIYHEFLHLSSLTYKKIIYEPFDEGYTKVLEERYFSDSKKTFISYIFEKAIMRNIEFIFGQDKLETLYFKGDFDSLINFIRPYVTDEELTTLYNDVSSIYEIRKKENILKDKSLLQNYLNNVFRILLICFINKNANNYEVIQNIYQYIDNFCVEIKLEDMDSGEIYVFNTMQEEKFNEIVEQFISNKNLNNKKRN